VSTAAAAASAPARTPLYAPAEVIREFHKALLWCVIPIVGFSLYLLTEKYLVGRPRGWITNPAEMPCRVFGYSHYIVAVIFMLSSRRMKTARGWAWTGALGAVSAALCVAFAQFGGAKNPVLVVIYFLYFMVHGYKDLVALYQQEVADIELRRSAGRLMLWAQAACLLLLVFTLVPAYMMVASSRAQSPEAVRNLTGLSPLINAIYVIGAALLIAGAAAVIRELRFLGGRTRRVLEIAKPVLWVLALTTLIALSSAVLGGWMFNIIILSHFVVWYFYADRRLQRSPAQASARDGIWKWMRGSSAGFRALHLGTAALFLVVLALDHYAFGESGLLQFAVGDDAFYYWTLVHVTISFAPR
jgi:hypothetical protein